MAAGCVASTVTRRRAMQAELFDFCVVMLRSLQGWVIFHSRDVSVELPFSFCG